MFHKKQILLPFLCLCLLFVTACFSYSKFLKSENGMLKRVAASKIDGDQKLDSLLASSVRLMEAALKPINPVKGGKLIDQYYRQNQAALQSIAGAVQTDFTKMNIGQQAIFALNISKSPHGKKFVDLYPKFKRKYKTVKAASKFLGFMGKSLGGLGKLGDLLE